MNTLNRTVLFAWCATVPVTLLTAQQKPAAKETDETTVQMSPFTVSTEKDTGYLAADVLTSSMLSTNLIRTPSDVTVLTRDFLDDIGAIDTVLAQQWLTSTDIVHYEGQGTNPTDFGTTTTFRGVGGGHTRNYWKNGFTPEGYITERIEGSRGPNGILYGDARR